MRKIKKRSPTEMCLLIFIVVTTIFKSFFLDFYDTNPRRADMNFFLKMFLCFQTAFDLTLSGEKKHLLYL